MFIVEGQEPSKQALTSSPGGLTNTSNRKSFEVSAWQIGLDRYLATLPPEVKQAFRAPANADDCLKLLWAAQAKNRKFDRIVTILEPLIEPLKRFESSVDVLVQTYSSIASPVWGPIKILVTIASTRLSTLHNVVILLERLVEPLKRFYTYELIFQQNAALRQAIGNLYCDLIEFCTRLVAHEGKSPFRKTFASFDRDVAEISDSIRFHWAEVDVAANAANLVEAKAARTKEDLQRAYEFQRDVNRWLSPATVEDDLERLSAMCAETSCQWLLETTEMVHFKEAKQSTSLRLCSWPGGGKSVAIAFLVKQFLSLPDRSVLYFFCRATDAERSFTTSIARTLVWQLLQSEPSLYALLSPIYNTSGRQIADSEVLVFEMLDTVLKHTTQQEIYIVLDALDECHDTSSLLNLLMNLLNTSERNIKLLLTSRDNPDLAEQLSFCTSSISLQKNRAPLGRYISNNVNDLKLPINPEQREEIRAAVESGSGGLWLFAKLMIDEIRKASSISEIYEQIQIVPDGLAQLYNTILRSREKHFSKREISMAQQIYLWLRMTDYIPQELWKARGANGLGDEVISIIFQHLNKSDAEIFKPMELILRLCSPLVTTRLLHEGHLVLFIEGKPIHCTAFVAEFFHQTADQYLQWCFEASSSQIPFSMQPRRLADLHRGACAVWYFGESDHFKHALNHLRERPRSGFEDCWLEIACGLWQALALKQLRRDLSVDELEVAHDLCDSLVSFLTTDQCLTFVESSLILHYSGQCNLLAENIQSKLSSSTLTPTSSRSRPGCIEALVECCDLFKADLLYSITRFPAPATASDAEEIEALKPEAFEKRPRAGKIFTLARRYRYLALSPLAVSSNGFLLGGKT
jgi:hypothetical protein